MVKSLFTGVTGLKSHQQRMDMIGNNIANVNTVGFKADVMTFADVYYQSKRNPSAATATLGGINPRQVGYGVKVSSCEANMSQSGYNYTDSKTDIALDGKGFFQVMDGAGNIYYTRAGHFSFDDQGYLVNSDGYHVLGVSGECDGVAASSDIIRAVIPQTDNHVSSATKLVNGTNVTVSVSAPSQYTNMSVAFKHADYPYATYANNILTVFFNQEQQYDSKEEFDAEIQKALTAGGVTLPSDVELTIDFDSIPDDPYSKAAANTVRDLKFTTEDSTCRFHLSKPSSTGKGKDHAYIDFSVQDNTVRDNVVLAYGGGTTGVPTVTYAEVDGKMTWTITIFDDTTSADINDELSKFLARDENSQAPKLNCTAFTIPTSIDRATAIKAFCGEAPDAATQITSEVPDDATMELYGASTNSLTGMFDFAVKEKGEFANNYKIQFAKKSGYDNTSAVWEENTLTINVCANTTIKDVNDAIKKAAGGNDKKIITFYDINGLDYGDPKEITETDGSKTYEYALGYTYKEADGGKWYDRNNNEVEADIVAQAFGLTAAPTPGDTVSKKDNASVEDPNQVVWNVAIRNRFFGGNGGGPSMNPKDGADSFYTKTAKSLSTFNLVDGRIGKEQTMDNFTDYMISSDGTIIGLHPIYGTMVIGRVDIATFDNPNGLEKVGGTNFRATVASGVAHVKKAGEEGAGAIVPNALEMSNVDLADEFTNMITTQRGYQANSRVITVSDTMIEELLSLKR